MAQQDYTSIILLGAAGLAALYAYDQGWFSTPSPSNTVPVGGTTASFPAGVTPISTTVMTLAGQQAWVAQMVAAGYSVATINTALQAMATQYQDCVAPSVWTTLTSYANSANNGCNNPSGLPAVGTTPITSTPPVTPTAAPITAPVTSTTYAAVYAALQSAAGTTSLTPDQWSYYWTQIGHPAISASDFSTLLSNMGITDRTQPMALGTFVAGLQSLNQNEFGISGFGNYSGIPVGWIHQGGVG